MGRRRIQTISMILTLLLISSPLVGFTTPEVQSSPKESDLLFSGRTSTGNVVESERDTTQWIPPSKPFLAGEDGRRSAPFHSQTVPEESLLLFPKRGAMETFCQRTEMNVLYQYSLLPLLLVEGTKEELQMAKEEVTAPIRAYPNREYALSLENSTSGTIRPMTEESASAIGVDSFWSEDFQGDNVSIAIIDTGVFHHQEFEGRISKETSFVNETYGYEEDVNATEDVRFHGTAVAGIAAGAGDYDSKGQGVAPSASIINARVFGTDPGGATAAAIIAAIEWAVKVGADVINLSLGTPYPIWYQDPEILAVNKAMQQGVTVVVAAGNEGDAGLRTMSVGIPAYAHEVITVGATTSDAENLALGYTSIGPGVSSNVKPDLSAPGNVYYCDADGGYSGGRGRGTSFAAPHIAGAAALVHEYMQENKSGAPTKSYPGIVKSLLMNSTSPIDEENEFGEIWTGTGVVNLTTAFQRLKKTTTTINDVPKIVNITPSYLPMGLQRDQQSFYPYAGTLFHNQTLAFNFTLAASYNTTVSMNLTGNLTDGFTLHSGSSFTITTPTTLWEFNFTVEDAGTAAPGYYCGEIQFDTGSGLYEVPMAFELETPRAHLLWDMQHTSWLQDRMYGQYRKLYQHLTENNVAVRTWHYGSTLESSQLLDPNKYDMVYVPDAASVYPIYDSNGMILDTGTTGFTSQEIDDFVSYVNNGGIVLLSGMNPESNNFTALNALTGEFGIEYTGSSTNSTETAPITDQANTHLLTMGVQRFAYQGCDMTINEGVLPVARYQERNVVALNVTGDGAFIATSTNFMFDDWNFAGRYASKTKESTENLVKNIIRLSKRQEGQSPYVKITSLSPGNTTVTGKNVTVKWKGGDTGKGVKYYATKINESTWTNVSQQTSNTFHNLQSGGTYTVYVNATDYQGLSNVTSMSFTVDATKPQVHIISPTQGTTTGPNITLTWDGSDNVGIDHYEVWDGETWTSVGKNTSFEVTGLNGSVTLKVKAIDVAELEQTTEISFTADGSGPKVTITSPKEGTTIKQKQVNITWSANDSAGVNYSKIQIDSGNWMRVNKTSFKISLSEDTHSVKVRVWDGFGNYNTATVSFTVDLEDELPATWILVGIGVGIIIAVGAVIFLVRKRR